MQENLATLRRRGVHVLEPATGRLAGGDVGAGRLPEPEAILDGAQPGSLAAAEAAPGAPPSARRRPGARHRRRHARAHRPGPLPLEPLLGQARGTPWPRSRPSSGREVTLVTTSALPVAPGVEVVEVETAAEMADAVLVAGRRRPTSSSWPPPSPTSGPAAVAPTKLRKDSTASPELRLVPTLDILAELGRRRRPGQVLVGLRRRDRGAGRARRRQARSQGRRPRWWPTTWLRRGSVSGTRPMP